MFFAAHGERQGEGQGTSLGRVPGGVEGRGEKASLSPASSIRQVMILLLVVGLPPLPTVLHLKKSASSAVAPSCPSPVLQTVLILLRESLEEKEQ